MKATQLYKDFFESEKSGGLVLIAFTLISLAIANSAFGNSYLHFWETTFAGHSIDWFRT